MKGKDIEESIILKLIVSPFVGVYGFFVIRGGCALFSVSLISWEQRKFSDIYQKNDERNNGQFGWNKTISTSTMTFNEIGNGAADSSIDNYKVLRIGDIAFEGHTNKEFRYGRFVLNDIGDGIMSPRFATLRPIIKQDFSFWKHYIHNERIMRKKLVRSTKAGTMMNELVIDDLMEQLILVPSLQEQKKIGAFFGGLNHLITLHQSKLFEHNKKKTCQFMISWEQRKLGDISTSYSGGTPTAGKDEYYGGTIPFIRSGEISSDHTALFLTERGFNSSSAVMVKQGDILYALYGATSGEVSISKLNGAINQAILAVLPNDGYDTDFIMQWLRKSKDSIVSTYLQGGQGNLSATIVNQLHIDLPSYNEQRRIGAFFKVLDNNITLHQSKLSYYRNRSIWYGSF